MRNRISNFKDINTRQLLLGYTNVGNVNCGLTHTNLLGSYLNKYKACNILGQLHRVALKHFKDMLT